MSKICSRDYGANSMLSVKPIDGVGCCSNCEKPIVCHNKPLKDRALYWSLSKDTGISSRAVASHMLGLRSETMLPPSDSSDRRRCISLLELVPEWINRLNEMAQYDEKQPEGIVINSSGMHNYTNSWSKQIPLILKEGKL